MMPLQRLDLYILRRMLLPFGVTVTIAAMLLLLERMLRLFDFVINENGPADVVWQMLAHLVPHYLGLALPVGLFLGTLLAFRNLSLSSELDALMATGYGLARLVRPVFAFALVLVLLDVWLVGWQQPLSRYQYRQLEFELRSGALGASVRVGEFVPLTGQIEMRVGGSRDAGRELVDIFLRRTAGRDREITATARRGGFFATEDDQTILLRLFDGRLVELDPDYRRPRVLDFESQDIVIELPVFEPYRRRGGVEIEMTLDELFRQAGPDGAAPADLAPKIRGNLHWRLIHILTFLAIPLIAAPLGIADKRSGSAVSLVAGLALLIVYNELTEAGERGVALHDASPFVSLWGLYAGYLAIGVFLFAFAAFRPGRGVAGMIDRAGDAALRPARRLLRAALGERA